jgi:hypothetical protein
MSSIRRDLRGALDDRERRELRRLGNLALANLAVFSLGIPLIRNELPAYTRGLGSALAIGFSTLHMFIFCVWRPRIMARRREAEARVDPCAAERHAREDRRRRFWATLAYAVIGAIVVSVWIR